MRFLMNYWKLYGIAVLILLLGFETSAEADGQLGASCLFASPTINDWQPATTGPADCLAAVDDQQLMVCVAVAETPGQCTFTVFRGQLLFSLDYQPDAAVTFTSTETMTEVEGDACKLTRASHISEFRLETAFVVALDQFTDLPSDDRCGLGFGEFSGYAEFSSYLLTNYRIELSVQRKFEE
jgi:hypothetical protein